MMKLLLVVVAIALTSACDPCYEPMIPGGRETCALIAFDGSSEAR